MESNIVKQVLDQYFKGNYQAMGLLFGVTSQAVRKWEDMGEFPAKNGRTQQAHELTCLKYELLTPSAYRSPVGFKERLAEFIKPA